MLLSKKETLMNDLALYDLFTLYTTFANKKRRGNERFLRKLLYTKETLIDGRKMIMRIKNLELDAYPYRYRIRVRWKVFFFY